jgi:hypothetical protein
MRKTRNVFSTEMLIYDCEMRKKVKSDQDCGR